MNYRIAAVAIIAVGFGGLLVWRSRDVTPTTNTRPTVAATIFPAFDLTRRIAGDDLEVVLILPPGASPHTFEPTPSDITKSSRATVVYAIGHGFDDWAAPIIESSGAPQVILDKDITLLASHDEDEGPIDPHYWLDAKNALVMAGTIMDDLSAHFPAHKAAFAERERLLTIELTKLDADVRSILAPRKSRSIVTFHDAWYYFANAYGLKVAGSFEPSSGREPTPAFLAELTKTLKTSNVHTLFAEVQSSTEGIESFAKDNGITIATLDDIGGSPAVESYSDLLLTNAHVISAHE